MILGQEELFKEQIEAASCRYENTKTIYVRKKAQLQAGSPLQMDKKERVSKWLVRGLRENTEPIKSLDEFVQERFIGGNDLIGAQFFQVGALRSQAVGRVAIRSAGGGLRGYGTGFFVAPGLMMTNNHVLPTAASAAPSAVEMNYQIGVDGREQPKVAFALRPDVFFFTDARLDCTVVAVAERGDNNAVIAEFGFIRIVEETGKIVEGNPVNIIQHPSGALKQVGIRANKLVHVLDDFLHYETDTAPGSSGSPVFNDQWELVGLHHAGVPRKDPNGVVLARDGSPWRPDLGDEQIDWIANEGARVSVLAKGLKDLTGLNDSQKRLRNSIFEADLSAVRSAGLSGHPKPMSPAVGADGTITWSFPIEFSIRVPGLTMAGMPLPGAPPAEPLQPPRPVPPAGPAVPAARRKEIEDQRQLVRQAFQEAEGRKYYEKAKDAAEAKTYYAGIGASLSKKDRYSALHKLVRSTHKTKLPYKPALHLYPWVDQQPPKTGTGPQVRSVYSSKLFSAQEFANEDLRTEEERLELAEKLIQAGGLNEQDVLESDVLEATLLFNCEHVVPQSWFQKRNPMRGDLHHLFACESGCNSFRGNTPYFDFPDFEEAIRSACGKREEDRFEPENGKGEVARATLYFFLRYPGQIGPGRFAAERVGLLLQWHEAFPVTDYERHRNAAIFEKQGNRNPLIDHPEWSAKIEFTLGLSLAAEPEVHFSDRELMGITG